MVSIFSSMICVERRFSRAICMVKKPEVNPENNAATDTPLYLRGAITGVVATLVFLALVVPGFHGNFVRILGILIGIFFFAGAAAAYFGRNRR